MKTAKNKITSTRISVNSKEEEFVFSRGIRERIRTIKKENAKK